MSCIICGNSINVRAHEFREIMFGTGDRFEYAECGQCGTIRICEIPDLLKYYPPHYLSFKLDHFDPRHGPIRDIAVRGAAKYLLGGRSLTGRAAVAWQPGLRQRFPAFLRVGLSGLRLK